MEYSFNKNWIIISSRSKITLHNFVNSKEFLIDSKVRESTLLLTLIQDLEIFEQQELLKKFEELSGINNKKWLKDSIFELKKIGIINKVITNKSNLSEDYLLGLDRQLAYLQDLFPGENRFEIQRKIKETKLCVLGLGTVGQSVIQSLVAMGFSKFVCLDFDIVEERNIASQPIFRRKDIGRKKVAVISEYIAQSRIGNSVESFDKMIESVEDVESVVSNSDFTLHCCDYPRFIIHQWISKACIQLSKPNILIHSGRVGPIWTPDKRSSCYNCLEILYSKNFTSYSDIRQKIIDDGFGRYPTLAFIPPITGSIAAREILLYVLGLNVSTVNGFLDIKPTSSKIEHIELSPNSRCELCQKQKK